LKKTFTIIFILLGTIKAFSQANFYKIGVGVNAGLTTAYTGLSYTADLTAPYRDATKGIGTNKTKTFGGSLDYYFTPFINAGVEYNIVQLKDGPDQHLREFISDFSSIEVRGNVSAGQFFDFSYNPLLYTLRTVNVGLGFGVISGENNVNPYNPALDGSLADPVNGKNLQERYSRQHANDIGKKKFSSILTIPASVGYNFNFYNGYDELFLQLGLNYKMVFTFSDDIDGYNDDPTQFANKSNDVYTTLGVSLKYMFGPRGLYFR